MQQNLTETIMKRNLLLLVIIVLMSALNVKAKSYKILAPMKLETPEMKPELVELPANPFTSTDPLATDITTVNGGMDFDFFKSKTNPCVKPYTFMDDMTFVGVPLFIAGMVIKGDKAMFRVNDENANKNR